MKKYSLAFVKIVLLLASFNIRTTQANDSIKLNFNAIYARCLDADVQSALQLLNAPNLKPDEKAIKFKETFLSRFGGKEDKSDFLEKKKSPIDDLLRIYRDYWRASLLDTAARLDTSLAYSLYRYLCNGKEPGSYRQANDSVTAKLPAYINSLGLYTTGFARTGKLIDLLVWQKQTDTVYRFRLKNELIESPVCMMEDFITLGWEEYATLGRNFPGGWATQSSLYCVKSAYNLSSENFLISYLAHEGRHFSDYKHFPGLNSADLEYRGKLTELSMAKETLYSTIQFFINNARENGQNAHSLANFRVISELSTLVFRTPWEKDIDKWRTISPRQLNKAAYRLLKNDNKRLENTIVKKR